MKRVLLFPLQRGSEEGRDWEFQCRQRATGTAGLDGTSWTTWFHPIVNTSLAAVSSHHPGLALPCVSCSQTWLLLVVSEALSLGLLTEALNGKSHACQPDRCQKQMPANAMSSVYYCYKHKLHFSRTIYFNNWDWGHFSCSNSCQSASNVWTLDMRLVGAVGCGAQ